MPLLIAVHHASLQVNTFAPFLLTQSLWKAGLIGGKAGKSVVANISSLVSRVCFKGFLSGTRGEAADC